MPRHGRAGRGVQDALPRTGAPHGLKVRGREFRLFYPKPRSAASAAAEKYAENRITFRPHFDFGETNQEIDFVFFLNGLPILALELKHEANQNCNRLVDTKLS
jgi:type I restriction enzyme R subunit